MEQSKNYSKVKRYYDKDLWNLEMVKNAVVKAWITSDEYKTITGEEYSA